MNGHKVNLMNKLRRALMWVALVLIVLLIVLSIYGAFLGAERAEGFFNQLLLAVYWTALGLVLMLALAAFRRLVRVPGLLLIHAGCILVLLGAMWGSQIGHQLQKRFFGIDKIRKGRMAIYEGYSENRVMLADGSGIEELPFSVKLKDFRLEHYEPQYLQIQTRRGQNWRIPVEVGTDFPLGDEIGAVKILKVFENFKIRIDGDKHIPYDDPQPGSNPALEVHITHPDGKAVTKYVFERFPGHSHTEDEFLLSYQRVISEYISELQIIRDGRVVAEKDIEVNHPLHFGGYHLYQQDYDEQAGRYTILEVTSDTGLFLVYAGYWMLCIGVFWHLWLRHVAARIVSKKHTDGN